MNKEKKKISNIFQKKTIYCNIKQYNSPIFDKKRLKKYFLLNENLNKEKNNPMIKITKSSKAVKHNKTCISKRKLGINNDEMNMIHRKLKNTKSSNCSKENSKIINCIQKKITFQSSRIQFSKGNSNDNIIKNNIKNDKTMKKISSKNYVYSIKSSVNKNKQKNINKNINGNKQNKIDKIYFNVSNNNASLNKKKYFDSTKISISLDNIHSKKLNKCQNKNNQKSFEKNQNSSEKNPKMKTKFSKCLIKKKKLKKIKTKQSNNNIKLNSKSYLSNKIKDTKINLENKRKLYHCYRQKESKIKTENLSEIMSLFDNNNNNLFININTNRDKQGHISNINPINKNKNKIIIKKNNIKEKIFYSPIKPKCNKNNDCPDYSRDSSYLILDECCNSFNDRKLFCENNSTNDKSLITKIQEINKNNNESNSNIIKNNCKNKKKNKYIIKNNFQKTRTQNNFLNDNDGFVTYEFDMGNEQNNKINGVKTNNFDVKKPNEENLKFTIMKDEKESDISFSHASKIVIGNIEGYKDIIETDIKNNENKYFKDFGDLIPKRSNLFNNTKKIYEDQEDFLANNKKNKNSNLSTILKKESDHFSFNDCNFYDSFNMTNNLDAISSTITNNIIYDNKKDQSNTIYMNPDNNNLNENWNNIPFDLNGDRNIEEVSKIFNCSNIKSNNLNNISKLKYNNNFVNNQFKNDKIKKIEDVNNNCLIF